VSERFVTFSVEQDETQRLDKFLVNCLPEFSRARLQGLIRAGLVSVDGSPANKSGQALNKGSRVQVHIPAPQPSELTPEAIPLDIVFEDQNVIVVNKPAGMVGHPACGHATGTLGHAALAHAPEMEGISGEKRPGVVHRLDKDTSGLILLAKNDAALHGLQEQFRSRKVAKVYLALVDGKPPTPTGRIEAPVGRNPAERRQMAVVQPDKGREAISEYSTRQSFAQHTLLEVHPLTGRTHQIRLHLRFIGCPVAGDTIYGRKKTSLPLNRHFLHAWRLTIHLPGENQARTFEAPLPGELVHILKQLESE